MANPNPLYFDEDYARESRFGRHGRAAVVRGAAPTRATAPSPAIQGVIPGQHMIFGGDEWWFFGGADRARRRDPPRPDAVRLQGRRDRSSPGPTMFSRGDTTYINQRGELRRASSAPPRCATWPRTRTSSACSRTTCRAAWSDQELAGPREAEARLLPELPRSRPREAAVREGGRQARRRGRSARTRIATLHDRVARVPDDGLGRVARVRRELDASSARLAARDVARPRRRRRSTRRNADGLYKGPSRGHVQTRYAQLIGMPRGYGYGASMGAWIIDYLTNWAGEWGFVRHSDMQYRAPGALGRRHVPERRGGGARPRRRGGPIAHREGRDDQPGRRGDGAGARPRSSLPPHDRACFAGPR